ncbi:uncharacterized protein EV422DRAFT_534800 [Fimicolochytrium jonesii]|uniref:uncharacterized protein n=1 Tax=Fimicolochytrium jonesii TaxID=1396493 RepID=UPI0022FE1941|nr:uncharacterized protein EV422DRAFT_534800 [Fimicolochytrium jonesii]KAI8819455.1 hypothetical protein EV422DRAFT_534800 [Fimicolochytrium jonesii]
MYTWRSISGHWAVNQKCCKGCKFSADSVGLERVSESQNDGPTPPSQAPSVRVLLQLDYVPESLPTLLPSHRPTGVDSAPLFPLWPGLFDADSVAWLGSIASRPQSRIDLRFRIVQRSSRGSETIGRPRRHPISHCRSHYRNRSPYGTRSLTRSRTADLTAEAHTAHTARRAAEEYEEIRDRERRPEAAEERMAPDGARRKASHAGEGHSHAGEAREDHRRMMEDQRRIMEVIMKQTALRQTAEEKEAEGAVVSRRMVSPTPSTATTVIRRTSR